MSLKICSSVEILSDSVLSAELQNELLELVNARGELDHEALSLRSERLLFRVGETVIKAHSMETDANDLQARLRIVAAPPWNNLFLRPLQDLVRPLSNQRLATVWPYAQALNEASPYIPWQEGAELLAQLHAIPLNAVELSQALPRCRAEDRFRKALRKLSDLPATQARDWVLAAVETVDFSSLSSDVESWCHGDWHLGQLVQIRDGTWRMIDIEDMGVGDPRWDLARPAAFFALGLLSAEEWKLFLSSYSRAGGRAFPPNTSDYWTYLEAPARALVLQSAASALVKAANQNRVLFEDENILLEACQRMINRKE